MAGIGINLSGNDWLGLGGVFGGMSQGTAECGAKPVCALTKTCRRRTEAYNQCIQKTATGRATASEKSLAIQEQDSKNKKIKYFVIGIVSLVALIIILRALPRKK